MERGDTYRGFGTPEEMLEHAGWVRALARALVRDPATADDIVQDTWLAAMRRSPRKSGELRPWLARVVRNVATDRARAEARRTAREADHVERERTERAPDEIAESIETQKLLLAAVEKLADPLRSAVVRRYFHGKTSVEIAAEDGIAESTVRERIDRGLQALRRDLDASHRGDRAAWMAVLVPIAHRADVQAGASAAATATGVGLAMGTMWKISLAALVVLAAFVTSRSLMTHPEGTDSLDPTRNAVALERAAPTGASPSTVPDSRSSAALQPATTSTAPAAQAKARADMIAFVEARIVDKAGDPIFGAQLVCVDRVEQGEIQRQDAPVATSAPDGRVRLELHKHDSSFSHGRLGGWADTVWTASLQATAPRFAPHHVDVQLEALQTSSCGTIVLVEGGTVSGRAVDEHGDGLSDVTVRLVWPDVSLSERDQLPWKGLDTRELMRMQSGAEGTFRIEGVAVGTYRVWTQQAGRLCALSESFDVTPAQIAQTGRLVMLENTSAIRGRVVGVDGRPKKKLSHVLYVASEQAAGPSWLETDPGPNGEFVIDVLPGSSVDIYCDDSGGKPSSFALRKNIPAGSREVVLQLTALPAIDLLVQDEKSTPISSWNVDVREPAGHGGSWMNMGPGHVRMPARGLPFTMVFAAPGYRSRTFGPFDVSSVPESLVVTLARANVITGRITGAGRPILHTRIGQFASLPAGAQVGNGFPLRLTSNGKTGADSWTDGSFELTVADDGLVTVLVQPWADEGEDAPDGFARAEIGTIDLATRTDRVLDITLLRGGRLEGHVRGFTASTSTVPFVSASRGDGIVRSTRISSDGSYALEHLTPGEWLIRPTSRDYTNTLRTTSAPPEPANVAVTITNEATTQLDLTIPPTSGASLDGTLHWPGLESGLWTAHLVPPDNWSDSPVSTIVAADGTFHLETLDGGIHHLSLHTTSTEFASSAIECDIDLAPGPNTWTFAPQIGSISESNRPIRDLELEWHSPQGIVWTAQWRGGEQPTQVLGNVPAGKVRIRGGGRLLAEVDVPPHDLATVHWN